MKTGITNYSLYRYGLYTNQIVASMLGYDKSRIVGTYESLPIKSKKEIDIHGTEIATLLNSNQGIREIYNKLEEEILNNRLENNKEKIKEYIIKNYS